MIFENSPSPETRELRLLAEFHTVNSQQGQIPPDKFRAPCRK
jgi:hypothetical protein